MLKLLRLCASHVSDVAPDVLYSSRLPHLSGFYWSQLTTQIGILQLHFLKTDWTDRTFVIIDPENDRSRMAVETCVRS